MRAIFSVVRGTFVALSCALLMAPAFAAVSGNKSAMPENVAPRKEFRLFVSEELPTELEKEALKGSPSAALKIAESILSRNYASDSGFYWLTIAVENGSKEAMCDLGAFLSIRKIESDRIRARYWLERAMKEGAPEDAKRAKAYLDDMVNGLR